MRSPPPQFSHPHPRNLSPGRSPSSSRTLLFFSIFSKACQSSFIWGQITISGAQGRHGTPEAVRELKGLRKCSLSVTLPVEAGIQAHVHKSAETIRSQTMPWNAGSRFQHNVNEVEVTGMISFLCILAKTSALCPQAACEGRLMSPGSLGALQWKDKDS